MARADAVKPLLAPSDEYSDGAVLDWVGEGRRAAVDRMIPALVHGSLLALPLLALILWLVLVLGHQARRRRTGSFVVDEDWLEAAREYFAAELGKERPELDDAWLPWIEAAGLGKKVERWRTRHPEAGSGGALGRWAGGGGAQRTVDSWGRRFLYGE